VSRFHLTLSRADSQVLKYTFVQLPFRSTTLPQLLVVVVQALPVCPEHVQAALIDILNHAGRTACDLATLLQALGLALAVGLRLAEHEVVIVGFAACTDEEAGGEKGSGRCADFLDLRDVVGERSGVNEDLLVETGRRSVMNR
jgi:hypothetical protein